MENTDKTPPPAASGFSLASFSEDLWLRYAKQIVIAVVVVVVAAAAWFGVRSLNERRAEADNKKLGQIYVLLREDNLPAAEQALLVYLAEDPSGLARDKANLFLGKVYFAQQRYEDAATAYAKVSGHGKKATLLHAGALHGLAAARMQLADYAAAAKVLEELIAAYAVRTGDPAENLAGEEVTDLSPNVPNALWKLALCRRELGDAAGAREAAERLVRAHAGTREAADAEKLLTVL